MKKINIRPGAFPSELKDEIGEINTILELEGELPDTDTFRVIIDDESIEIPYRTYVNVPSNDLLKKLSETQFHITCCYLTRHHNGYIRERFLKEIILINDSWIVPYVIKLAGEYVVEILALMNSHLNDLDISEYTKFIIENPEFYYRTKQRVVSYWNCYYESEYKNINEYPGTQIIRFFESKLK
ncbi:hypothetical protein [Paenibacillus segetis]|uniref:Immunity protein 63 n=1 Tax=Paenibacillus segetis TaxID=1325360 RepID=A0ABQ1YK97_9BACL|nr:hypothetical protein [Paenibacillus segetis]GGH27556.1 hypothetical protein GCM10008013_29090 [Paenibacillus segetis]